MLTIEAKLSGTLILADEQGRAVQTLLRESGSSQGPVITEDNSLLLSQRVSGTVSWGDGSPDTSLGSGSSPLVSSKLFHVYGPGAYSVVVTAQNFKAPIPDTVQKVLNFEVRPFKEVLVQSSLGRIIGPILPRDSGFPNPSQWNFNLSKDREVLESSVKMILLTQKGERLMNPNYGTSLRSLIFEPETEAVETTLREQLVQALNEFEPRVQLYSLQIVRGDKRIDVQAVFFSRIDEETFQLSVSS